MVYSQLFAKAWHLRGAGVSSAAIPVGTPPRLMFDRFVR